MLDKRSISHNRGGRFGWSHFDELGGGWMFLQGCQAIALTNLPKTSVTPSLSSKA
jgi:hypothetical protein